MAIKSHKVFTVAALATIASQNASAFTPYFLGRASNTRLFSSVSDVSIDYDAAAKLAYEQWRAVNGKGGFDQEKYNVFKANYEAITIANVKAAKKARDEGMSTDDIERLELNEYADMTAEDYMSMQGGGDEPVSALDAAMDALAAQDAASGAIVDAAVALADEEQKLAESLGLSSVEELEAAMDEMEGIAEDGSELDPNAYIREAYNKWCKEFGKQEDESRFPTFASNYLAMEEYAKENGKIMQLNKYADCTEEEYIALTSKASKKAEPVVEDSVATEAKKAEEVSVEAKEIEEAKKIEAAEAAAAEAKKADEAKKAAEAKKAEEEAAAAEAKKAQEIAAAEKEAAKKKAEEVEKAKADAAAKAKEEASKKTAADIEKEKQQRQAEQEKARAAAAAEAEAAAIAAAKAIAEKEAAQVAKRRALDEQAAEIERQKAKEMEMKLAAAKPAMTLTPPVSKDVPKPPPKKEAPKPAPKMAAPKSAPAPAPKVEIPVETPAAVDPKLNVPVPKMEPVAEKKESKLEVPSILDGLFGKSAPSPAPKVEKKDGDRQFSFGNPNQIAAKKAAAEAKEKADAAAITAAVKAATKEAVAEKAAAAKASDNDTSKKATAPLFGGIFSSPTKAEEVPPPPPKSPPTPTPKPVSPFDFFGAAKPKIEEPAPAPVPVAKKPEPFSFFSKPAPKKETAAPVPPPTPTPAPKPAFSLFGGATKPAPKKETAAPVPPPAPTPAPKPAFSLFGGAAKPAPKKEAAAPVPPPAPTPAPKPAFSLFGGAAKPKSAAPAPTPAEKKQAPVMRRGTISLGSPGEAAAASKSKSAAKNDGIPTLSNWKQEADGSITGNIRNSKMFREGQKITTSPIRKGAKAGTVVTTSSGSKYRLL